MISRLNNLKSLKSLWMLMALLLLNCSVDTGMLYYSNVDTKDIGFNHQESVIEIVIEQFLGFENAIPEFEDSETEQHGIIKKGQIIDTFILPNFMQAKHSLPHSLKKANFIANSNHITNFFFKIPSPPPEV